PVEDPFALAILTGELLGKRGRNDHHRDTETQSSQDLFSRLGAAASNRHFRFLRKFPPRHSSLSTPFPASSARCGCPRAARGPAELRSWRRRGGLPGGPPPGSGRPGCCPRAGLGRASFALPDRRPWASAPPLP